MKKNKPKTYLKLGILLFGISIFLINCQQDDLISNEQIETKTGLVVKKISLEELQHKQKLQKPLQKLAKVFDFNKSKASSYKTNSNLNSKIDANDGSFTILTDEIVQVTTDSTTTYAFRLETPVISGALFDNFVIDVSSQVTSYKIVSYVANENAAEDEFQFLPTIIPVNEENIDTNAFSSFLNNRMHMSIGDWVIFLEWVVVAGGGADGCNCGGYWVVVDSVWTGNGPAPGSDPENDGMGGYGTGPGEGTNPEDSGGGHGGTSNPTDNENINNMAPVPMAVIEPSNPEQVIECIGENNLSQTQQGWLNSTANAFTVKVMASRVRHLGCDTMANIILDYLNNNPENIPFDEFSTNILNCMELQNLLTNTDFTSALSTLQGVVGNNNQENEKGYNMYRENGVVSITEVAFADTKPSTTKYTLNNNFFGGVHMHQKKGLFPMFSVEDIINLSSFYQIHHPFTWHQHENVHILVTIQGTYALKINDYNALNIFAANYNGDGKFQRKNNRLFLKYMRQNYNEITGEIQNSIQHQKKFLKFATQDNNIGVSLYKLDGTTWVKKELDSNENLTPPTNCN